MTFTTEKIEPDIAVVRGEGKLNMVSAPELRTLVLRVIEEGENRVVVDLSGIEFMDSSGLGALVGCLKSARRT
jgi:anti-sigma B factor antagonist